MHAAPTICLQPCPEGTRIHQKPTASSEGAQLWDKHHLTLSWFREAGPTIILNIIVDVSVPLRGTIGVVYHIVPTAALLRSLQWVSLYRSRSTEPLQNRYFCDIIHLLCCLTSFDTHINIVRYTHPHRSIHTFISNDVR